MIGDRYWSTGITIHQVEGLGGPGWSIKLQFFDNGFCNQKSSEGELHMRYVCDDLAKSIDILIADAQRLGIEWNASGGPTIYWPQDGEDPDDPPPPGWERIVREQCDRLGWRCLYRDPSDLPQV